MTIRSGRRPIIWSDMALRHSQTLEELPRELVLMDGSYLVLNRSQPVVKLPSHDTMRVPDVRLHLGNCTAWAAAGEHGLLGLCCTCWPLRGQLLPLSRALGSGLRHGLPAR